MAATNGNRRKKNVRCAECGEMGIHRILCPVEQKRKTNRQNLQTAPTIAERRANGEKV